MDENLMAAVERELLAWPGVVMAVGRFDSVQFNLGRREIGHVHRDGTADLPFPRSVHDELIAAGAARPHRAGVAGFVSVRLRSTEDVAPVVALFRRNYERAVADAARRASENGSTRQKLQVAGVDSV